MAIDFAETVRRLLPEIQEIAQASYGGSQERSDLERRDRVHWLETKKWTKESAIYVFDTLWSKIVA